MASSVTNENSTTGSLFVLVTMLIWTAAVAQSDCSNTLMSMAPCLNYVSGSSGSPSSSCCSSLASVVGSQPQCLCTALNSGGGSIFGITIDRQRALALPGACNVKTPPVSLCDAVNGPVAAPKVSPAALEISPVATSDSPASSAVPGGTAP